MTRGLCTQMPYFLVSMYYTELVAEVDRDGVVDKENMKHGIGVWFLFRIMRGDCGSSSSKNL